MRIIKVNSFWRENKKQIKNITMNTPNLHAFEITYLGTTNSKGSRVKIKSLRFNESKIIPYDHNFNNTLDIAKDYLTGKGFNVVGQAETPNSYIVLSDTFKNLK